VGQDRDLRKGREWMIEVTYEYINEFDRKRKARKGPPRVWLQKTVAIKKVKGGQEEQLSRENSHTGANGRDGKVLTAGENLSSPPRMQHNRELVHLKRYFEGRGGICD